MLIIYFPSPGSCSLQSLMGFTVLSTLGHCFPVCISDGWPTVTVLVVDFDSGLNLSCSFLGIYIWHIQGGVFSSLIIPNVSTFPIDGELYPLIWQSNSQNAKKYTAIRKIINYYFYMLNLLLMYYIMNFSAWLFYLASSSVSILST